MSKRQERKQKRAGTKDKFGFDLSLSRFVRRAARRLAGRLRGHEKISTKAGLDSKVIQRVDSGGFKKPGSIKHK